MKANSGQKLDVKPLKIKDKNDTGLIHPSKLISPGVKRTAVVGASGSGKTRAVSSLLTQMLHPPVDGLYIYTKIPDQENYRALERWCAKKRYPFYMRCGEPEDQMDLDDDEDEKGRDPSGRGKTTLDEEDFHQILGTEAPKMVIFDDLADDDQLQGLIKIYQMGRVPHAHPNSNIIMVFPINNPYVENQSKHMIAKLTNYPDAFFRAYDFIKRNKHAFILVEVNGDNQWVFDRDLKCMHLSHFSQNSDAANIEDDTQGRSRQDREPREPDGGEHGVRPQQQVHRPERPG
jgi:hypothetical protein